MFFKKKVNIRDYCYKKYNYIFSKNGFTFMDNLLIDGGISINIDAREVYYSNFIAAYFVLASIAFSRTLSRSQRYKVMEIEEEFLLEKTAYHIHDLIRTYNSAFGSSFEDGVKPMAQVISERLQTEDTVHCEKYFYGIFYGILNAFFKDIKAIKIIS